MMKRHLTITKITLLLLIFFSISPSVSSFSKIKPQLAATGVDVDGFATIILTNGVGTPLQRYY